jgi:hypothetical protein
VELVRLSAAVAFDTPSTPSTVSSVPASSVERPISVVSVDWLSVVLPSLSVLPPSSPKSKEGPPSRPP